MAFVAEDLPNALPRVLQKIKARLDGETQPTPLAG